VDGATFLDGVSKEDYHIVIESVNTTVEKLTANEIDFRPPILAPDIDERFSYGNVSTLQCDELGGFHVQVIVRFHSLTQAPYWDSKCTILLNTNGTNMELS